MGVDLRGSQPTPGNIEGGISTLEEKSLGRVAKGRSSRIVSVVEYAEECGAPGLTIMDTPGHDIESMTGMVAGGATVILFSTGRGKPCGCPIALVIKVSASRYACQHMRDNIDFPIEMEWGAGGDEALGIVAAYYDNIRPPVPIISGHRFR